MRYFPLFLELADKTVLIVGGGEEALRKARLLAKTDATIHVVAADVGDELASLPSVTWVAKTFTPDLLDGVALVVVAEASVPSEAVEAALARGLPVNVVDHPELSTFIVPSIIDRDPVVVAIGTEGQAPILGQGLRARFDALLPQKLGALAAKGGTLRDAVANRLPAGNVRRGFWRRFFFGDAGDAFLNNESARFDLITSQLLSGGVVASFGRISFVSAGDGDPELLTLKGHRRLQEADVIIHDADVPAAILESARRDATRFVATSDFTENVNILSKKSRGGQLVVRLRLGGYSVEELVNLAADGLPVEIVPGATAASCCEVIPFPGRAEERGETLRAAS